MQALLAQWADTPAVVLDRNLDVAASTPLAEALAPGFLNQGVNLVLATFDGAAAFESSPTSENAAAQRAAWYEKAAQMVAALRYHGEPRDPRFQEILGILSVRHRAFREIWARYDARPLVAGPTRMRIEGHGWVDFSWQVLEVPNSPGYVVLSYWCPAGSPAALAVEDLALRLRTRP
ncbi:MmyB family transcriptional regulator [Herbiconiux liukaitaii]|uniref:MmyB family transcriptional regulator n=1 Tax=Herbiconiux liukaitaii TaxID=3342799 RepID=UPI0035B9064D